MARVVVSKQTLIQLIRSRLAAIEGCEQFDPLPIARKRREGNGCNWTLAGWTGYDGMARHCREALDRHLALLRAEFDIPEDEQEGG